MSTDDNKSTKTPENPLEEPSRPAAVAMMRDDTTVPVFMCMRIPAISNRGAVEMDEILFIKIC